MKEKLLRGTKERLTQAQSFYEQLEKLNPTKIFFMKETTIKVDSTPNLWELKFPEGCEILTGKNKEEIKKWGYLTLRKYGITFYIYSQ